MEFFNNKENDILKFKINSDGINYNDVEPRLILMTKENKNVLLIGTIENDVCKFEIPKLSIYEKGDTGKMKFEIISEELYFPVWQDTFEIKSKASIKIEEMISEVQKSSVNNKPKISLQSSNIESKPIIEKRTEVNDTLSKLEAAFESKTQIVEEDEIEVEKTNETVKVIEEDKNTDSIISSIMKFDSFK